MIEPIASETTLVIVFTAVTAATLALTTLFVGLIFFAVFDGGEDSVRDVQRFIELTEEARALLPNGLPLFDPDGMAETSAAIARFQAKKDEARKALWQSRQRRAEEFASEPAPQLGEPARLVANSSRSNSRAPARRSRKAAAT
jgi:hypothetical protein